MTGHDSSRGPGGVGSTLGMMTGDDRREGPSGSAEGVVGAAEALLAAAPDAIVVVDGGGIVVEVNPAVEQLFGYPPAEIVGKSVEILLPEALRAGHVALREGYVALPHTRPMGAGLRLVGRRRDGTQIAIDVSLAPVPSPTGLLFGAFVRDATEQRRAEARLAAVNEISQALLAGEQDTNLWAMTAHHARNLGDATWAAVIVPSDGPGDPHIAAGDGDGMDALVGHPYPPHGTFAEEVVLGRQRHAIADLGADPRATEMARRLGVGPAAAVAVADAHGQVVTLIVSRRIGEAPFAPADLAAVQSFAAAAAVALALGEARADLERLSIVEEHDRIARDLHDTVIQRLFATGMSLAGVQGLTNEPVAGRIGQAVGELDDTIREIRSTIFELQQPAGSTNGLRRQVQAIVTEAGKTMSCTPRLAFDGPVDTMVPAAVTVQLLAVVRESLSNIVRHSKATAVDVVVGLDGPDLVLTVTDDGVGPPDGPRAGNGLRNMASRADHLGGTFTIGTGDARGTAIEWRVPIH